MIIEGIIGDSARHYASLAGMSREEWKQNTKFVPKDLGWIIMFIGGAIGAGIVFLPVQVGLVGLWVYIFGALAGYPVLYRQQRYYLNVLAEADECKDFTDAISSYMGKNWGFALGILYFMQVAILIFLYATALNNDSASFLVTFHVTGESLASSSWYSLGLVCLLVLIASQSEKLIMKLSSFMVFAKLITVAVLGCVMIQYWNLLNLGPFPDFTYFCKEFIVILPLVTMSIAFFSNLSPAVVSYRKNSPNKFVAQYKALRAMNLAYLSLVVIVVFYTVSFNLSVSHEQAVQAFEANISSLAMAARNMDGALVKILSLILNIFAVVTAFFAIFMAFRDSCVGLAVNILQRFIRSDRIHRKGITAGASVFCVFLCWSVIALNIPVVHLASLLGPLMGLIGCIMPVCIIWRTPFMQKYRGPWLLAVFLIGVLLVVSPFIALG